MSALLLEEQIQQNQFTVNQKKYRDILGEGYALHWYEVQSLLGRGGYGITYLAMDKNLERKVAIKEYLPIDFAARQTDQTVHPLSGEHGDMYKWGLERFLKEARTLAKFNHPNIVRVLSVFEHNNTAYMVMEYEQGEDLSSVFKKKTSFTEEELLDIFIPVLDGLSLVHREGFIHRDIKPSNIYIRDDQSPVLIDFGSARQASGQTRTLTSLVTYGYAPFEQYNEGHEKQGPWTDIYALGATMYFGITKSKPEDALKRGGAILADSNDPYEPLSIIAKGRYSENLLLAIDNAMRFRAEDRPQDVLTWADMLLGKTKAPALPPEMVRAKPAQQNMDSTMIMPAGFYDKHQQATGPSGRSKRNTSRLIDSSGRRATGEYGGPASAPEADFSSPPMVEDQPISAPPRQFQQAQVQPPKSKNTGILAIVGLIVVLSIAAIVIVMLPEEQKPPAGQQAKVDETTAKDQQKVPLDIPQRDEAAEKIVSLLAQAKKDFDNKRYVKPEGANAAYRYLQVLEIDPNNKTALEGLEAITQHYAALVKRSLEYDKILEAESNLQIIESIAPRSAVAMELRLKMQTARDHTKVVAQLVADADRYYRSKRFTKPEGENALDKYRQALRIDPSNQDAKRGVQKIFEYYADAAENHVAAARYAKAESVIDKMDTVQPGSVEAEQLRKRLDKLTDKNAQVAQLLRKAKSAYNARRYTQPNGNNALAYYQKVLRIDANNSRAKYGIEEIVNFYKKQFDRSVGKGDFDKAEQAVNTIDYILPNSSMVVAMYKKLEASKPPPKPEIEIISGLVSQFKKTVESHDVSSVKGISEFVPGRAQFVEQFFANYQSFKMNISGFQYIAKEHKATAHVSLSRLINKQGHAVQPGAWGEFDIVVQKNKSNQWRVFW